jgi:hypothetical protein
MKKKYLNMILGCLIGILFLGIANAGMRGYLTFLNMDNGTIYNVSSILRVDGSEYDTNLSGEEVQDYAGNMWAGNTETRATVTYQDGDGTIDIVVDDMNDDDPEPGDVAWTDLTDDGTFTDTKYCTYESALTRINCNTNNPDTTIGNCSGVDSCNNILYSSNLNSIDELNTQISDELLNESSINSLITTVFYNVSSIEIISGTGEDNENNINEYDDASYNISEVAGSPGMDIRLNVTGITEFNEVILRYKTDSGESHTTLFQLYHFGNSEFRNYGSGGEILDWSIITLSVFNSDNYIQNGTVIFRIYTEDNGNTNHKHYFDWITFSKGIGSSAGTEVDPFSIHKDQINTTQFTYNFTLSVLDINEEYITNISINENLNESSVGAMGINYGFVTSDNDTTYTGGNAITLSGSAFDFDGGASPSGELGGTWASPTIDSGIHDDEYIRNNSVANFTEIYAGEVRLNPNYNATHWCLGVGC